MIMLHFFQKKMSSYSSDTRLSRQRQVTTLSVYNETVEEVVENSEYRVRFNVNSIPVTLEVKLPPEFPECPPVIFCSPPLLHPWITKGARVTGAPGLINFKTHSDLGMVVAAVRRELEKSRPSVNPNATPVHVDHHQQQSADLVRKHLMQLEKDELQDIIDNEGALEKFLSGVSYPPLDNMVDNIASMEENIKAQAKHNIALQGEIETLRDTLLNRVQEYHAKKQEMEQLHGELSEREARVRGDVLADKLVRMSVSKEEISDNIADKFLACELGVDQFLQDYIKIRTECHLQKLKADKVKKLP